MNKYYGKIGYGISVETAPGIWTQSITERFYYGDILRSSHRWETGTSANDDLNVNNQISILADAFAYEHAHTIRYASFMGTLWKVTNIEIQSPRLILTFGGEYNGEQA